MSKGVDSQLTLKSRGQPCKGPHIVGSLPERVDGPYQNELMGRSDQGGRGAQLMSKGVDSQLAQKTRGEQHRDRIHLGRCLAARYG